MEKISKLKKNTIVYLIIYLFVLTAVFLIWIYPNQKKISELNEDIISESNKIEEQRMFGPLFKKLLLKTQGKNDKQFPVVKSEKFPKGNIFKIPLIFTEIAKVNKLIIIKSEPDVNTLKEGSNSLRVKLALKGDFFNFREFLIELYKIPYMIKIESIQIDAGRDMKEFRIKIWLALDNK